MEENVKDLRDYFAQLQAHALENLVEITNFIEKLKFPKFSLIRMKLKQVNFHRRNTCPT